MKTLVKRSAALFLTLALLFTITPFTALAEAAETDDGMDESMSILETYEEETDLTVIPEEEQSPAEETTEETGSNQHGVSDLDETFLPDDPDSRGRD